MQKIANESATVKSEIWEKQKNWPWCFFFFFKY